MEKTIVSIERKEIDPNKYDGIVLGESASLLLLQYIYDFRCDGLVVLDKADKIQKQSIDMKCFTGTAKWLPDLETIRYSDITCCRMECNYIKAYETYFEQG